jgi:CubicO group peptidase (beta-lactamase class C family)
LTDLLSRNAFGSAAVAVVMHRGEIAGGAALGFTAHEAGEPVTEDTLFDLASLTKPILATVVMTLVEDSTLSLDEPVGAWLPSFRARRRDGVTLRRLLSHTAGLPAVIRPGEDPLEAPLVHDPGAGFEYSCVGYMVIGLLAAAAAQTPLETLVRQRLTDPLGLADTGYRPAANLLPRIAATEILQGRGLVHGAVHDEVAWGMGGVSGNAGIFGTARDVARFGEMLRLGGSLGGVKILHPSSVLEMTRDQAPPHTDPGYRHGLGLRLNDFAFMGALTGQWPSFGHTGFTGTSLVVDSARELVVVLLTNRVHPSRELVDLMPVRRAVAGWAAALA